MISRLLRLIFSGILLLAIGIAAAGFNPREFARKHGGTLRLSIATGNTGGVYYPYGGGLARVISQSIPNVDATAEVTNASVDNLKLIQLGKADIAFTLTDTLEDAARGRGTFARARVRARTLAVLYPNYTHLVTIEGRKIGTLSDLRGRVVSIGSPGSGTEVIATRLLRAVGIDPHGDIRRQSLGVNASVDALKDGKIDAFFWSGGLPTASVLDLASTANITAKLIANDEVLAGLHRMYTPGLYFRLLIPGGTYPGIASDVGVVGVANALVVADTMSDDLAYELTKVLFDRQRDLAAIHPEAKKLSLATATQGSPTPFHPGAIRYYQERGAWR